MKMVCPDCLGPLVSADGKTARCTLHGGQYQVLFVVGDPVAAPPPLPAPVERTVPAEADTIALAPPAPVAAGGPPARPCAFHASNPATATCHMCGLPVCPTCAFVFPTGLCCCPACATKPPEVSGKRKTLMVWAYILAVWSVAAFVGIILFAAGSATSRSEEEALGVMISLLVFVPSLVGVGLGFSAIERRGTNSMWMWGAVVLNCIVLAVFILLSIVGSFQ